MVNEQGFFVIGIDSVVDYGSKFIITGQFITGAS